MRPSGPAGRAEWGNGREGTASMLRQRYDVASEMFGWEWCTWFGVGRRNSNGKGAGGVLVQGQGTVPISIVSSKPTL